MYVSLAEPIYGDRFIVSNFKTALYSETKDGHKTVSVKLEDMQSTSPTHSHTHTHTLTHL